MNKLILVVGCLLVLAALVYQANAIEQESGEGSPHPIKRSNIWEFFQSAKDKTRETAGRFCGIFGNRCEKFKDFVDRVRDKLRR